MKEVQPIRSMKDILNMKETLNNGTYGERNEMLFTFGINTGLRVSDILPLKVGDVRGKDKYTLTEQKTGKTKKINLKGIKGQLDRFTEGKADDEFLFSSRKGGEPLTRIQAYRILNDAAAKCGLDEIGTHTMRKTFGYHHYQRNHDVAILQQLFNHSAPSITLRYIGIAQDEIDASMEGFSL